MGRTITVRGTGTVTAAPDRIELTLNLNGLAPDYAEAAENAEKKTAALTRTVEAAGFEADALKTTAYNVSTEYKSVRDPETGEYRQEFAGYRIYHGTQLSFALDLGKLAALLGEIAESGADPELSIRFTVGDPEKVRKEALEAAAKNAREKAEILAAASGVKLGQLLSIQYDWNSVRLESGTMFDAGIGLAQPRMLKKAAFAESISPQDVTFSDSAGFVWEITD